MPSDASALVLNALLGLGTVSAPVFVAIFVGLGFCWGLPVLSSAVFACYQLGYGVAAFGTGPLVDAGASLPALFGAAAVTAVVMGGLSFTLARKSPAKIVAPAITS